MKTVLLFALLFFATLLANAQSKVDSAIRKADSTVNVKNMQIGETKDSINAIQKNIDVLLKEKTDNQNAIINLNNTISDLKKRKINSVKQQALLAGLIKKDETNLKALNTQIENASAELQRLETYTDAAKRANEALDISLKEKKDTIAKAVKTLDLVKASIINQLDSSETIATVEMLDSTIVYDLKDPVRVKIKKVHLNVSQGMMLEIIVTTDRGVFRNSGRTGEGGIALADLLHFEEFMGRKLFRSNKPDSLVKGQVDPYLILRDVIRYTPINSFNDAVYGEFEITLPSVKGDKIYLIKESTSINSYFNLAAFTDIKGISGEPNGIAQFTADAKFMLRTKSISKSISIVALNYISFQAGLSKFDSEFKGTELNDNGHVDRKDLLQRANYQLGVKLNLLKGFLTPVPKILYNSLELNVGYNVIGSQVFKTSFKDVAKTVIDTAFKTVTQNQWYVEPTITFSRRKNFSMCLGIPFYMNNVKASAGILNRQQEYWAVPGVSLMYFGKRDVGSKIFFRYNHYINLNDNKQAFSQMQLGYSLNITQVLNK